MAGTENAVHSLLADGEDVVTARTRTLEAGTVWRMPALEEHWYDAVPPR